MSKPSQRSKHQNRPRNKPGHYSHRQPARTLALLVSFPLLICAISAFSHRQQSLGLWLIAAIFVFAYLLFSSLTISVSDEKLQWHFGPGLIRKQVNMADVASAELIRTRLLDGWGIHFTKHGWLYNVSGYDAVAITMKNGKHFTLGSNDAAGLWEALQQRITPTNP